MNKTLSTLAISLLLISSPAAFAASTVDLTVKGLITPSACTPSLSNGGVVDHGKISAKDLRQDGTTVIGNHMLTLTVNCDAAIRFALHAIDNRAGTSSSSDYGLGLINGTQQLGRYILTLRNPIADTVAVQPIGSQDGGTTWFKEKFFEPGLYMSVATMDDHTQPLATKELVADLDVQTIINRADSLDLSNEVLIDGSATLEVKYL